jgi:hypothetical protein
VTSRVSLSTSASSASTRSATDSNAGLRTVLGPARPRPLPSARFTSKPLTGSLRGWRRARPGRGKRPRRSARALNGPLPGYTDLCGRVDCGNWGARAHGGGRGCPVPLPLSRLGQRLLVAELALGAARAVEGKLGPLVVVEVTRLAVVPLLLHGPAAVPIADAAASSLDESARTNGDATKVNRPGSVVMNSVGKANNWITGSGASGGSSAARAQTRTPTGATTAYSSRPKYIAARACSNSMNLGFMSRCERSALKARNPRMRTVS